MKSPTPSKPGSLRLRELVLIAIVALGMGTGLTLAIAGVLVLFGVLP